jgi:hypothetical protein
MDLQSSFDFFWEARDVGFRVKGGGGRGSVRKVRVITKGYGFGLGGDTEHIGL